jgi:hypothetical protein
MVGHHLARAVKVAWLTPSAVSAEEAVRAIPGSRAAALARPPEKAAVSLTGAGTIVSAIPSAAGAALTR